MIKGKTVKNNVREIIKDGFMLDITMIGNFAYISSILKSQGNC